MNRVVITGGAGFVGSNLAVSLASRHPEWEVVALDNLYRKGSELNLPRLQEAGVEFVRGDVRDAAAVDGALRDVDAVVHLAAIPVRPDDERGDLRQQHHQQLPRFRGRSS